MVLLRLGFDEERLRSLRAGGLHPHDLYLHPLWRRHGGGGCHTQPLQWSSEYADPELGLVYYNYRSYNPIDGRWNRRDPDRPQTEADLFSYAGNKPSFFVDHLGMKSLPRASGVEDRDFAECVIVQIFIKVRKWTFFSEKYEWQPDRENAIGEKGKTPYQYPTLILESKWRETSKCRALLSGCYEIPNVSYLTFLVDREGRETKK